MSEPLGRGHRTRISSQSWLTFRQALGLGGDVRKGERGTTVVYADCFTPEDERAARSRLVKSLRDPVPQTLHGLQRRAMRGTVRGDRHGRAPDSARHDRAEAEL